MFSSVPTPTCGDAGYLRNCIVYTHLNPVRAGLVPRPEEYEWTSHCNYIAGYVPEAGYRSALQLFATGENRGIEGLQEDYRSYIRWRMLRDSYEAMIAAGHPGIEPPSPAIWAGDLYWRAETGGAQHEPPEARDRQRAGDLRDFVQMLLRVHHVELKVEYVRGDYRSREIVRIRRFLIERSLDAGFRGHEIARFLDISPGAVSTVRRRMLSQAAEAFSLSGERWKNEPSIAKVRTSAMTSAPP